MKNPSKEKFKLEKVKLISGGGMAVKFQVEEVIGAESYRSGQDITSSKEPHPDLTDRLRAQGNGRPGILLFHCKNDRFKRSIQGG